MVAGARERSDELDALVDEGQRPSSPSTSPLQTGRPHLVAAAMRTRRVDILVNNVGAVATTARRVPDGDRRPVARLDQPEPDGGGTHHPGGAAAMLDGRPGLHRDHQLGQRVPARPRGDRLQRRQGGPVQLLQGALQGGRPARHPGQHRQPGAGRHRSVARRRGRRGHRRRGPPGRTRRPSRPARRPPASPAGSRSPTRSATSWCSSPATPLATSPAPTSPSTAG